MPHKSTPPARSLPRTCRRCARYLPAQDFRHTSHTCILCADDKRPVVAKAMRQPGVRYAQAKWGAAHRGTDWDIPLNTYLVLLTRPCFYCKGPLQPTGSGLDRLDPHGGYVVGNVVQCCWRCNAIKSDYFTVPEMLELGSLLARLRQQREELR